MSVVRWGVGDKGGVGDGGREGLVSDAAQSLHQAMTWTGSLDTRTHRERERIINTCTCMSGLWNHMN